MQGNIDHATVKGFGEEWRMFDQSVLAEKELRELFDQYFKIFPWQMLSEQAVGFDLGCGSGRWAKCVAPTVGRLHCIDASEEALVVAKRNLAAAPNCEFHRASVDHLPLGDNSMDFGYALGVLHHVPNTAEGIQQCVKKLKPGAPFLLYLYYAFDNRPAWFRWLWYASDVARKGIAASPFPIRYGITQAIATLVYYPLARLSLVLETLGFTVGNVPLSAYRRRSFYTMRTDTLDRFGTRLEQRFTAEEIRQMMEHAGLRRVVFSDSLPYWCALGYKE